MRLRAADAPAHRAHLDGPAGGRGEERSAAVALAAVDPTRSEDLTYYLGRDELGPVGAVAARAPVARDDLVLALNRPEDLDVLRAVFGQAADPLSLTLGDAIAWLDDHPDVAASNREYVPKPTECDARLDLTRLTP